MSTVPRENSVLTASLYAVAIHVDDLLLLTFISSMQFKFDFQKSHIILIY